MQADFLLKSYDYELPQENIAQHPAEKRDGSKLLLYDRNTAQISHKHFAEIIDFFCEGDILVVNDTKVFPARLFGRKQTGGKAEVFLLELPLKMSPQDEKKGLAYAKTTALIKSSKRPAVGADITISDELSGRIHAYLPSGKAELILAYPQEKDILDILARCGSVPLPPYIERNSGTSAEDRERYQTVYAAKNGAVAAPTAGLHFTEEVLEKLIEKGVKIASVTLHVGYGTFAPVRVEKIDQHDIHSEYIEIAEDTAHHISETKKAGGKVWAVGTTTVRALEYSADSTGILQPTTGWCDLYITPGYTFSVIDNLITNFHLPKSSLLFLVSALCGREKLLHCYREAIAKDYRFYSYGDAMAILS